MKTQEETIKFLEKEFERHQEDFNKYIELKIDSCKKADLKEAEKYDKWAGDSWLLIQELTYILHEVKK